MRSVSDLMTVLKQEYVKAWGCDYISYPILKKVNNLDDIWALSCFGCRQLTPVSVSRPLVWGNINLKTGEIIDIYPCFQSDFARIQYNQQLLMVRNEYNPCSLILLTAMLNKYWELGTLDEYLHEIYFETVLQYTNSDFHIIYERFKEYEY